MAEQPDALTLRIVELCRRFLREPVGFYREDGAPVVEFDPPLTVEEQATYADIVAIARSQESMTPALYAAVREQLQTLRALRQLGRNAFMAQTAAERDRQLYDALDAATQVLLAILRD